MSVRTTRAIPLDVQSRLFTHSHCILVHAITSHEILMQFIVVNHLPTSVTPLQYVSNHIAVGDADLWVYPSPSPYFPRLDSRSARLSDPWIARCVHCVRQTRHGDDYVLHLRRTLLPFSIFGLSGITLPTKPSSPGVTLSDWLLRILLSCWRVASVPRAVHVFPLLS